jgi:transcriptional regulator with XRE-family HTH domain
VSVGKRVARLRLSRGDSLRDAAARTGVSHTTIARIEKGEVMGSLDSTLRSIALGYGVPVEFLLGEQEPWADFQRILATLRPEQRAQLMLAPRLQRIRMVVDFLAFSHPGTFSLEKLAEASRLSATQLREFLATDSDTDDRPFAKVAAGLQRMCGIDPAWLSWGGLPPESGDPSTLSAAQAMGLYQVAVQRAAANGIDPRVLEMAVDMLALQSRNGRAAAARQEQPPADRVNAARTARE